MWLTFLLSVESGIPHEVVAAVDINDHANAIYRHNFPATKLMQRCIEVRSRGYRPGAQDGYSCEEGQKV